MTITRQLKFRFNERSLTGVCKHPAANRWQAQVSLFGQRKYLGLFKTHRAAALAALNQRIAWCEDEISRCRELARQIKEKDDE